MLERFGYHQEGDGFRVDLQRALDETRTELSRFFGFRGHNAVVQFAAPGGAALSVRRILEQRGHPQSVIDESVRRIGEGTETGGSTLYTGDLELDLRPRPEYMVFFSTQVGRLSFLFNLGEEITHGEHISSVVDRESITYREYQARFNALTEEFLGRIGFKRILQVTGGTYELPLNINWKRDLNVNEWEHFIAYWLVDDLIRRQQRLPVRDLFHAPDQTRFWEILLRSVGNPLRMNFKFPQSLRFEGIVSSLNELLRRAKADKAIKLNLSYED